MNSGKPNGLKASEVTIIVSPRERYSSLTDSLSSLFNTIPPEVRVIVVEGNSPEYVRRELQLQDIQRPFELIALPHLITPQEARNIGLARVDSRFVVFADNDIHYQPDWLHRMVENATRHAADLVAPLICIGPPEAETVHHAGGRLVISGPVARPYVVEKHRLMNRPISRVNSETAPIENEIVEFHCFLARTAFINEMGGLDERLITREQIDLGLRAKLAGAKVTFEAGAIVTYMAKVDFREDDLEYLSFRWSDELAKRSLRTFTNTWKISSDSRRVLGKWIRPHRFRAYRSVDQTIKLSMKYHHKLVNHQDKS